MPSCDYYDVSLLSDQYVGYETEFDFANYGWTCDETGCDGYTWAEMAAWIQELYEEWGWVASVECDAYGCTENLEGWGDNWYNWEYYKDLYESVEGADEYDSYNYDDSWWYDQYYGYETEFDFANYGWTCNETGCDGQTWAEMAAAIQGLYEEWGWVASVECDAYGCTENLEGWGANWYDWEYYVDLYQSVEYDNEWEAYWAGYNYTYDSGVQFDFANYGWTCNEYGCDG
jgi:hypothetical protein